MLRKQEHKGDVWMEETGKRSEARFLSEARFALAAKPAFSSFLAGLLMGISLLIPTFSASQMRLAHCVHSTAPP